MKTLNFNSSLNKFFDEAQETFDARDLCQSLVVYANRFYNYFESDNCSMELRHEMLTKALGYKLNFIADCKKEIINDFKYYRGCDYDKKEFERACKKIKYQNFDDFFLVLDWIEENWGWPKGEHYFACFMNFSENEPMMIHEDYFYDYAKDLGEECYSGNIRRGYSHSPLLDFIDWNRWADFVKCDYDKVSNPLNTGRYIFYEKNDKSV